MELQNIDGMIREMNANNVYENIIDLDGNLNVNTEMKVGKITSDDLRLFKVDILDEMDLGCCIRLHKARLYPYATYLCVDYRKPDGNDLKITLYNEDFKELTDMAAYINEQIPTCIFDKLKWDYIECGDHWSINPSSYYAF